MDVESLVKEPWGFDTICQHLAEDYGYADAVVPPIFQTSLFVYDKLETFEGRDDTKERFYYTRVGNPTNDIYERKLAALERTEKGRLFGSGMGAIAAAVMSATEAGKHIVVTNASYGPTKLLIREYLPQFGVESTFVDGRDIAEIENALRPSTSCRNAAGIAQGNERRKQAFWVACAVCRLFHKAADKVVELAARIGLIQRSQNERQHLKSLQ